MGHIKLKPSKSIKVNFDMERVLDSIEGAEARKVEIQKYQQSLISSDSMDKDLLLRFDDIAMSAFDYIYKGEKIMTVEIDPVTIFYANAKMSSGRLDEYKNILIAQAIKAKDNSQAESLNLTHSAYYYQLAINTIINLQASLECFANKFIKVRHIEYYNELKKRKKKARVSTENKLFDIMPLIFSKVSKSDILKTKSDIKKIIDIRNDVIHLNPLTGTNSAYKHVYSRLLDMNFDECLESGKLYLNLFIPDIIQDCECGKEIS